MAKKADRKGATKTALKMPLMALSEVEERELLLDSTTLERLEAFLSKNGGTKSGLSLSDAVAHLLLGKGLNGFRFTPERIEKKSRKLKLPKAAWNIAEKSAEKSGCGDLSEVVRELASKL